MGPGRQLCVLDSVVFLGLELLVCSLFGLMFLPPEGQGHFPAFLSTPVLYFLAAVWIPCNTCIPSKPCSDFLWGNRGKGRPKNRDCFLLVCNSGFFPSLGNGGHPLQMPFVLAARGGQLGVGQGLLVPKLLQQQVCGMFIAQAPDAPSPEPSTRQRQEHV